MQASDLVINSEIPYSSFAFVFVLIITYISLAFYLKKKQNTKSGIDTSISRQAYISLSPKSNLQVIAYKGEEYFLLQSTNGSAQILPIKADSKVEFSKVSNALKEQAKILSFPKE